MPGAWQFPQGGVDPGEETDEALFREVREEVGLSAEDYEVIGQRDGYRYLYPEEVRKKKARKHGYHGQEQTYYLCRLKSDEARIDVCQEPREFADFRWIDPGEFQLDWVPGFKREVYRDVLRDFFQVEI